LKSKCSSTVKSGEKGILEVFVRQKMGTFFGKEVLQKCAKRLAKKKSRRKGKYGKLMPIIYIKGSFYETPMHGHVRSDKQDGDKGQGMRRRSPGVWRDS